jgi:hypothetical protein
MCVSMRIRYICASKTCRREVETEASNKNGTFFTPTCECGSEMKRAYFAPAFTRLSEAEAAERFGEFVRARKR